MLHRLSAYFFTWPDWIKMLLLVTLTLLTITLAVSTIAFVVENIR